MSSGNREVEAGQQREEGVVHGRRCEQIAEQGVRLGLVGEHGQQVGVLVAEDELDRPVLERLEARRAGQRPAEFGVLARGEGGQHRPLLDERPLDVLHPGQALQSVAQLVVVQEAAGGPQLVEHKLQPELAGLVLDDEQQLVVVLRAAHRVLRVQQPVEIQVAAVGHRPAEIGPHRLLELADRDGFVVRIGHGFEYRRCGSCVQPRPSRRSPPPPGPSPLRQLLTVFPFGRAGTGVSMRFPYIRPPAAVVEVTTNSC